MMSALFWVVMQCVAVIPYRSFVSSLRAKFLEDGIDRFFPKRRYEITIRHCVTPQKSTDFVFSVGPISFNTAQLNST